MSSISNNPTTGSCCFTFDDQRVGQESGDTLKGYVHLKKCNKTFGAVGPTRTEEAIERKIEVTWKRWDLDKHPKSFNREEIEKQARAILGCNDEY